MKRKTVRLALAIGIIGLFASCKMNAQNDQEKREGRERPSVDELFKKMDANEDGLLSLEEVKGPLKKDFSKIDTDEDGFLSKKEIEDAPKPKGRKPKNKG